METYHQKEYDMGDKQIKNVSKANEEIQKHKRNDNDNYKLNYHFSPITGWINDPNGLIYYKNKYHAFYQYNPYSAKWGPMHWGHAMSDDLIKWEHLPIALAPSEDYDLEGCLSGSAVELDGEIVLIYTGTAKDDIQAQCLAKSSDGIVFKKYGGNPVIPQYPVDGSRDFRDPKVWKHKDKWYMAIGSAKEGRGKILAYRSNDLISWQYLGVALKSVKKDNCVWECPNIIPVKDKHLMILSSISKTEAEDECVFYVGDMDYHSGQFTAEYKNKLDYGTDFYAPQVFYGSSDRIIMIGWMGNWKGERVTERDGWEGAFTLPRDLKIIDNRLYCAPVGELKKLRHNHTEYLDIEINSSHRIKKTFGNCIEILTVFDNKYELNNYAGINIYFSDNEKVSILYDNRKNFVSIDFDINGKNSYKELDASQLRGKEMVFNIFIDVSSIEIFINNGAMVITERIYPYNPDFQVELEMVSYKDLLCVKQLNVWSMNK
ncbi:MAG: glycoside hydrolase family 32 protein [Clostridiales bacterium]|nr:glycoside hydrolase family 32 protein [Clostridiales bacterium]